jgi:hypothetical protein
LFVHLNAVGQVIVLAVPSASKINTSDEVSFAAFTLLIVNVVMFEFKLTLNTVPVVKSKVKVFEEIDGAVCLTENVFECEDIAASKLLADSNPDAALNENAVEVVLIFGVSFTPALATIKGYSVVVDLSLVALIAVDRPVAPWTP